jgi:hypothetical protein
MPRWIGCLCPDGLEFSAVYQDEYGAEGGGVGEGAARESPSSDTSIGRREC